MIEIPVVDSKQNYLSGFWKWVEFMEAGDYQSAIDGLYWKRGNPPAQWLKDRVTTFFSGPNPWFVVTPNQRLISEIENAAAFKPRNNEGWGWLLAMIPLTTEPANAKSDEVPLMGLATSFYLRPFGDKYVFEFEIFHA